MIRFLTNRIDPSVIFHIFRRDLLNRHGIVFRDGYHEDVDYMFRALFYANRIAVLPKRLYRKWNTAGSIVNTLGPRHIDGYLDALAAILDLLASEGMLERFSPSFSTGLVNVTSSRLMRLLNSDVTKDAEPERILTTLHNRVRKMTDRLGLTADKIDRRPFRTKYETIFVAFMRHMDSPDADTRNLIQQLDALRGKSWSCYDLHNSVFFAPDEIRTCCKRFFADGMLKGDVVLMRASKDQQYSFTYEDIRRQKAKLHFEINRDNAPECRGCPFLTFDDWGLPLDQGIKYISLEYHSLCNMRCVYCSDTYFGGQKPKYDVGAVVDSIAKEGNLSNCEYIVWGGGEPLVEQSFPKIARQLAEVVPKVRQRVITNCTIYSETLTELLTLDRAFIVTSIDAGSEKVFRQVRQYKHFNKVMTNLQRYRRSAPENVIVKYILMPENSQATELSAFVDLMVRHDLLSCNFQISSDFKSETMATEQVGVMATLYGLLLQRGANFVFTDDLVWQRFPLLTMEDIGHIVDALQKAGLNDTLANLAQYPEVVVWGTGAQARLLLQKTHFLKTTCIAYFVDPRPEMIGREFCGRPVRAPSSILKDDLPVVIAAVQSAPFIFRDLKALGITPERVIRGLIL